VPYSLLPLSVSSPPTSLPSSIIGLESMFLSLKDFLDGRRIFFLKVKKSQKTFSEVFEIRNFSI
jgi:hypothetical protein